MSLTSDPISLRRAIYALLILTATAGMAGRIAGVGRVYEPWLYRPADAPDNDPRGKWPVTRPEPMPTHGANDRSRWATVRALVENHTYVIGRRKGVDEKGTPTDEGIVTQDGWGTIDKVLKPDTQEFYSSKPPLLPTLIAGEYWLFHHYLGWEIADPQKRWIIIPIILITVNVLPWALALWVLAGLIERHATTDWARLYLVIFACFGTFLTTFGVTLNNHTVACWSTALAVASALRAWSWPNESPPIWLFASAGFFSAFAAANELPALAFLAALLVLMFVHHPGRTLVGFLPAAVWPIMGFVLTNYLAIGEWLPAYEKFGGPWYDFAGSHWQNLQKTKQGIDAAGYLESRDVYAFHLILGHHGVLSLTPVFLLSLIGMIVGLFLRDTPKGPALVGSPPPSARRGLPTASLLTLGVTAVVMGFYIGVLGDGSRNYGGWTAGPRWLFWLTPLWVVTMIPVADWLGGSRAGRLFGSLLLILSIFSVNYPEYSPWRQPWLYNVLESLGIVKY